MTHHNYTDPVSELIELGDPRGREGWRDYTELGIGPEHIPDLIRLALDDDLAHAPTDSDRVWAGLHAWRALAHLRAEEAVRPLTRLLRYIDEHDDQWAQEELPQVFGHIGPPALPILAEYLADQTHPLYARVAAAHAIQEIGSRHPQVRDEAVKALATVLERFVEHDPTLNAFLISFLVDLDAVETAPLMELAFAADCVDLIVMGDWQDAQLELGLIEERETRRPDLFEDWMARLKRADRSADQLVDRKERARDRLQQIGRNAPCWCGSGRKYKHCHLREDQQAARA
jgi:hypothetical protein